MVEEKVEKVIEAARQVFLRYGFKRTTMGDIASAARMSRPALYLVFPSKEEVFTAVMTQVTKEMLSEIHQGIGQLDTVSKKLIYAFDLWTVAPFEMTLTSPDAKDLLEGGYEFTNEVLTGAFAEFEALVGQILEPLVQAQTSLKLNSNQIAHVLVSSVPGFKQIAKDTIQLRQLITGLITITLTSLHLDGTEL